MRTAALDRLGLVKTSLIDFPGRVAAVVFTAGCNFHCPFCHNPDLVGSGWPDSFVSRDEVLAHLVKRRNLLDGVVITGGEPTIHGDLPDLVEEIRSTGLEVKIDTNGSNPAMLAKLSPDFVACDLKCGEARYGLLTEIDEPVRRLRETIAWLIDSGVEYELRTTVVPGLVDDHGFNEILLLAQRAGKLVLNEYRPDNTLDPHYRDIAPYPLSVYEAMVQTALEAGVTATIRGPSFSPLARAGQ